VSTSGTRERQRANGRDPDRGYITWRPIARIQAKLEAVQDVLATYQDHLPMTVRQIFYVLVARLVIQKTALQYRNLAYVLRKARRARIIPFEAIHDQGSTLPKAMFGYSDEGELVWSLRYRVQTFDLDPLTAQPHPVILWCEAAGMLHQLTRVGGRYGVDAIAGGGFDSVTDKWQIVQLIRKAGIAFEVLHVGDLDPHGESIFEVLSEDIAAFDEYAGNVTFSRIAVTKEQIALHNLPTDPDHPNVVQAEALPPDVLAGIVEAAVRERLDLDLIAETEQRSAAIRAEAEAKLRAAGLWGAP
jgi:hypothetical protein